MTLSQEDPPPLPPLSVSVEALAAIREDHIELLREGIVGRPDGVHAEDHLVIAALRRSLDNILGFLAMVDQRNVFCGVPIIRFQLDTAMSLYARNLVKDVLAYASHITEGKERRGYCDRTGRLLTDSYLHRELTKKYESVTEIYGDASGYIHFSRQHMLRVLDLEESQRQENAVFRDIDELTAGWSEEEVRNALVEFLWATHAILVECTEWKIERRRGAGRRGHSEL